MRWVVVIIAIVVYFFLVTTGLNSLLKDEFYNSPAGDGNTTFTVPDTTNVNVSILDGEDTSFRTTFSMFKLMLGFRTPVPSTIPQSLAGLLSFINWFLIALLLLALYRLLNPFGGS